MTLMLLDPIYQPHFKHSVSTEHKGTPRGLPKAEEFTLAADAWELDFDEILTPTIIRGDYQDAKSHGRVWIDPDTSRVLITGARHRSEDRPHHHSRQLQVASRLPASCCRSRCARRTSSKGGSTRSGRRDLRQFPPFHREHRGIHSRRRSSPYNLRLEVVMRVWLRHRRRGLRLSLGCARRWSLQSPKA